MRYEPPAINFHLGETPPREPLWGGPGGGGRSVRRWQQRVRLGARKREATARCFEHPRMHIDAAGSFGVALSMLCAMGH